MGFITFAAPLWVNTAALHDTEVLRGRGSGGLDGWNVLVTKSRGLTASCAARHTWHHKG